jgi:DNA polymerase-3 subunit delta
MSARHIHLLLGPEAGEKREHIQRITQSLGDADRYVRYAFETSLTEVLPLLRNPSLFDSATIVELRNAELLKKKADIDMLGEYAKGSSEGGMLILTSDETRVDRKLEAVVPKANKKIFWEMFEDRKKGWLTAYFRKRGMVLTDGGAEELLEMVANTTDEMRAEADKLCLFFPQGSRIDESDIERYIYHSKEENVFTLFERVAAGDLDGSLEILHTVQLAGDSHPVQILGGLLWQFRRLQTLRGLLDARYDRGEALRTAGIRGKRSQGHYLNGARTYTGDDLERILVLFADTDAELRSTPAAVHAVQMELFLYYVIIRRGRTPEPELESIRG